MVDDKKKSKIDLKARLGKTSIPGTGGAGVPVPLPTPGGAPGTTSDVEAAGGAPAPQKSPSARPPAPVGIAPPGLSPGIPIPPFAQQQQKQAPPPKATAAQQTIKVEESEVIHQERKKAGRRIALFATVAAVLGLGIGFPVGIQKERSDRGKLAVAGAGLLEKDVRAANEKMKELSEKLNAGAEKLGGKSFPAELVTELGAINIPFDAANLDNKQVGSLPGKTLRALLSYTSSVQNLNETKDSLKNLLSAAQAPVEKAWKEEKEPVVSFSVIFGPDGSKGMLAELVPNKEPFPAGKDWPASYKILRPERTQQGVRTAEKTATRWLKGDLTGTDPIAIPVAPASVAAFTSEELVFKLGKAVRDIRQLLEGNKDNPTTETPGLLKEGDDLANELRKLSLAR